MAEKTVANYKDLSDIVLYNEEERWYKFTYDFSVQGGATTDTYNFCLLPKCALTDAYLHVETAATSGGSATVEIGVGSDTDGIIDQTAVASLTEDNCIFHNTSEGRLAYSADDKVFMTIGTAALTAGKMHLWLKIKTLND